ncbi:caspase, EACC1-associated type [Streptomyces sp. CA-106131]|uniref:caspase family protein n=1 Tax=Streptomyces sp. CA-106131 TaxID=3240045 RepID=UPI003D92BB31
MRRICTAGSYRIGEAIANLYRDRRRDDLTLLYFTGHGLKDDDGRLYLATANTRRSSLLFTSLPAEQIDQAMSGSMSRRNVLILDCCYSGAFPAGRVTKGDTDVHTLERFQGRGRTVLTASDATQYSFEGNQPQGEAAQSVFTRYLVAGLRDGSADLDGDGNITLDELYSYVHDRVVDEMPQQRPKKLDNVEGRIVIARNVNWSLPAHLRTAIDSPIANARIGALDGLAHLYRIDNETVRGAVLEEIRRLAADDSRVVSAAATAQLQSILPAPPEAPGRPTANHVPDAPQPTIEAPPKTTGAPTRQVPQTPLAPAPGMASDGPPMEPPPAYTASPPPPKDPPVASGDTDRRPPPTNHGTIAWEPTSPRLRMKARTVVALGVAVAAAIWVATSGLGMLNLPLPPFLQSAKPSTTPSAKQPTTPSTTPSTEQSATPSTKQSTEQSARQIVVHASGPPPWTVSGFGWTYTVKSVARTTSEWQKKGPSLTVTAYVERSDESDYFQLEYDISDQAGNTLENVPFQGSPRDGDPPAHQRRSLVHVVWDAEPQATHLTFTVSEFYSGHELVLKDVPVPSGT